MMMEYELALQFVELHMLPIEFGGDVRLPVFRNLREFIGDVDFVHRPPRSCIACSRFVRSGSVAKKFCGEDRPDPICWLFT
jgi:hypothetical protein